MQRYFLICSFVVGGLFATTAPVATAEEFVLGQTPFASTSSWNTPVPPDATYSPLAWPVSNGYIYSISWDSYSPAVYVSSPSDPIVTVSHTAGWGYPAETLYIRMPVGATGAVGTDGEMIVVDGTTVHNFWQFNRTSDTSGTCQSYARCDVLTGTGWGTKSPFLAAGINAAGSSQLAGLIVQAESDAGEILHALQLKCDFSLTKPNPVGEAISSDGGSSTGIIQEGQRVAIPRNATMPSGLSTLGQKVFRALRDYGAFDIDVEGGGGAHIRAQANAYDAATAAALWHDLDKLIPMLQAVSGGTTNIASNKTAHGIPYSWLGSYGIANTNDSVETENPDGDDLKNLQEYIVGTDPTNPDSCFSVGITNAAGQIIVCVPSVQAAGSNYAAKARYYDIELRTNLLTGSWQPDPDYTNIFGNGSFIVCTNETQDQAKFYRAKARLQP